MSKKNRNKWMKLFTHHKKIIINQRKTLEIKTKNVGIYNIKKKFITLIK